MYIKFPQKLQIKINKHHEETIYAIDSLDTRTMFDKIKNEIQNECFSICTDDYNVVENTPQWIFIMGRVLSERTINVELWRFLWY